MPDNKQYQEQQTEKAVGDVLRGENFRVVHRAGASIQSPNSPPTKLSPLSPTASPLASRSHEQPSGRSRHCCFLVNMSHATYLELMELLAAALLARFRQINGCERTETNTRDHTCRHDHGKLRGNQTKNSSRGRLQMAIWRAGKQIRPFYNYSRRTDTTLLRFLSITIPGSTWKRNLLTITANIAQLQS